MLRAMTTTTPNFDYKAMQEQVLDTIKQAQGFTLDAVKSVTDTVAPLVADLPKLPFADQFPTYDPSEAVEAGYAFVNELLAAQHDFTKQLLDTLRPVATAVRD